MQHLPFSFEKKWSRGSRRVQRQEISLNASSHLKTFCQFFFFKEILLLCNTLTYRVSLFISSLIHTQRDSGGKNILSKNWASFLKARLNCSIPGEFPFYFNEIRKYLLCQYPFFSHISVSEHIHEIQILLDMSLKAIPKANEKKVILISKFPCYLSMIQNMCLNIPRTRPNSMQSFQPLPMDWLDLPFVPSISTTFRRLLVESSRNRQPPAQHGYLSWHPRYLQDRDQESVSMTPQVFLILF